MKKSAITVISILFLLLLTVMISGCRNEVTLAPISIDTGAIADETTEGIIMYQVSEPEVLKGNYYRVMNVRFAVAVPDRYADVIVFRYARINEKGEKEELKKVPKYELYEALDNPGTQPITSEAFGVEDGYLATFGIAGISPDTQLNLGIYVSASYIKNNKETLIVEETFSISEIYAITYGKG